MTVLYRKFQNMVTGSATAGQWYGKAISLGRVSTKELAREISAATTLTYPDVIAVLTAMTEVMGNHLRASQTVDLEGIGAFKVGIKTAPAPTKDAFTAKNIQSYHINYLPVRHFLVTGTNDAGYHTGTYTKDLLEGIKAREAPRNLYGKEPKKKKKKS